MRTTHPGYLGSLSTLSFQAHRILLLLLLLSAALILVQPCAGGSGSFSTTGSLANPRGGHTAALLPNGTVLVAGGSSNGNGGTTRVATAEVYDPTSGAWTTTGSLTTTRDVFTATALPNGKVLAAGGLDANSNILASAELYDSTTGIWTATGSMASGRESHAAALLSDGKVLVVGGITTGGLLGGTTELYDPATGTWTTTGSLVVPRFLPTATLLHNGQVLVAGGLAGATFPTDTELYDPMTGIWTATGSLNNPRDYHTATLLPNGKVLVAGGSNTASGPLTSAELYDPTTGTWTATGSLAMARVVHTATLLPDGKVLVAGGSGSIPLVTSSELYDPATGTWTATGDLVAGRYDLTATALPNGNVLVAGGIGLLHAYLASAELYTYTGGQSGLANFLNISTRLRVLTDPNQLIAGFIITGTDPKNVIVRGIGPSLMGVGVPLADPTLELHQNSTTLATNDNWKINDQTGQSQQAAVEATTVPPTNDLESAILATLTPGAYTAILAGKNGGIGVGVVEVYDLTHGGNSQLANISTRGFVDTDSNVMIGGFIIGGSGSAHVIIRALGPSVPVTGALADPTLELHDPNGATIDTNDNWKVRDSDGSSQQAEIEATTVPPTNDLESALVETLAPGGYTAVVRGKNNTTGVGLVEAYRLSQ